MAKNRKAAEAAILKWVKKAMPGSKNAEIYKAEFDRMSDADFDLMIDRLRGGITLPLFMPNTYKKEESGTRADIKHLHRVCDELGIDLYQRVYIPATDTARAYLTPRKYMVMELPFKRQAQLLVKKISIPADNTSTDFYTGQTTGKSKGAAISLPELSMLNSLGLNHAIKELIKFRGGDEGGMRAMDKTVATTGQVSLAQIEPYATGVKSTWTLKQLLLGMQLQSTLTDKTK